MFRGSSRSLALLGGLSLLAGSALAAGATEPGKPAPPTAEQRSKMAEMHRRMADCLASDRSIDECRAEMQASCAQIGYAGACGMMAGGGHRMGGGPMHANPPAPKQ